MYNVIDLIVYDKRWLWDLFEVIIITNCTTDIQRFLKQTAINVISEYLKLHEWKHLWYDVSEQEKQEDKNTSETCSLIPVCMP